MSLSKGKPAERGVKFLVAVISNNKRALDPDWANIAQVMKHKGPVFSHTSFSVLKKKLGFIANTRASPSTSSAGAAKSSAKKTSTIKKKVSKKTAGSKAMASAAAKSKKTATKDNSESMAEDKSDAVMDRFSDDEN